MVSPALRRATRSACASICLAVFIGSCGWIADKDRIRIATFDAKPITRGDFEKVIRNMAPEERPLIRTKGDVRKALQNYLDTLVRNKNAKDLLEQKKIFVPRELAEAYYRFRHPEAFIEMTRPEDYNLTQRDVEYMKEEREIKIDEAWQKLQAEEGVRHRIEQAVQNGLVSISDAEFATEFEIRRKELVHFERVAFSGVLVPGGTEESRAAATEIKQKILQGSSPAAISQEYAALNATVIESVLANDPSKPKYKSFWEQATGAPVGGIVGPVFIQGWTAREQDAQGKTTERPYSDGMLVFVVTERSDEKPKTLEESKKDLEFNLLYAKMMEQLRTENGVQIFDDKLPDPGIYNTNMG